MNQRQEHKSGEENYNTEEKLEDGDMVERKRRKRGFGKQTTTSTAWKHENEGKFVNSYERKKVELRMKCTKREICSKEKHQMPSIFSQTHQVLEPWNDQDQRIQTCFRGQEDASEES